MEKELDESKDMGTFEEQATIESGLRTVANLALWFFDLWLIIFHTFEL